MLSDKLIDIHWKLIMASPERVKQCLDIAIALNATARKITIGESEDMVRRRVTKELVQEFDSENEKPREEG